MKKIILFVSIINMSAAIKAQEKKYQGLAFYNTQTDIPFGKLAGMFTRAFHPGIEWLKGNNFSIKQNHYWYWDVRAGYFHHRFVQHGITLYSNIGYRYKISDRWTSDISIGTGYLQSIPASSKLKLQSDGNYKRNNGFGRAQLMGCLGIGVGYLIANDHPRPITLFINYQQRLQTPFVKSYVPLLPYNSFMLGISRPLKEKK